MPLHSLRTENEQLSQFERGRIIGMMEAEWSARRVARQLGRSDCVVRRCWDQWIRGMSSTRRPSSGRPRQTSHREDTTSSSLATNPVRISDANRVRVWKPRGDAFIIYPAFALERHTAPTAGVMVLGVFAYNKRSTLVLIHGTMTAKRYVHDILKPHVFPLIQRLPGAIFQQDNAQPHTANRSLVGLITSAGTGEYFPPLQFTCRNCGDGDRGRVAIYHPFGEFH
ncbi:transposable element Tcb2 transposase [Trichonephila clavipes]|uniref:Transposable element Tcb2 transposase n=1 Tax=Trichonephila clavipes TaxID=2585209 RepID=A0A8X6VTP1_TRICX|nr:transposable element Tcb2 transposase [Trichonephila clavipes]